jgi:hypothetical protein
MNNFVRSRWTGWPAEEANSGEGFIEEPIFEPALIRMGTCFRVYHVMGRPGSIFLAPVRENPCAKFKGLISFFNIYSCHSYIRTIRDNLLF